MPLYRRVPYGRLANFHVLDTRQYRTDQPCGDRGKPPCEASYDPARTILGDSQRGWLFEGLAALARRIGTCWPQQVMMARVDFAQGDEEIYSMDQWPGYEADRRRVLKHLHERKIKNPVVLTGDIHTNWANELPVDFDDLDGSSAAVEFVGTSIIIERRRQAAKRKTSRRCSRKTRSSSSTTASAATSLCEVTPDNWRSDFRTVEYVTRKVRRVNTRASFVVESGQSKLEKA